MHTSTLGGSADAGLCCWPGSTPVAGAPGARRALESESHWWAVLEGSCGGCGCDSKMESQLWKEEAGK